MSRAKSSKIETKSFAGIRGVVKPLRVGLVDDPYIRSGEAIEWGSLQSLEPMDTGYRPGLVEAASHCAVLVCGDGDGRTDWEVTLAYPARERWELGQVVRLEAVVQAIRAGEYSAIRSATWCRLLYRQIRLEGPFGL